MSGHVGGDDANWGPRIILGLLALVVALAAGLRAVDSLETSSVTATTYAGAAPSPTSASQEPPTATPSPVTGTVVTKTNSSATDAVEVALISFVALFILMAMFYNRLSSITGPGIVLGLSPAQKHSGAQIAAKVVATRVHSLTPRDPNLKMEDVAALGRLPVMALRNRAYDPDEIQRSTEHITDTTARVTELTLALADRLMRLRDSPDALEAEALALEISPSDIDMLKRGIVPHHVWERLAQHSLTQVAVPSS